MYRKSTTGWLKHGDFLLLDLLCLLAAFSLSYLLRNGAEALFGDVIFIQLFLVFMLDDIAVVFFFDSFKNVLKRGYYQEFIQTLKHVVLVVLFGVFYLYITKSGEKTSRLVLMLTGVLYALLTYGARLFWKYVLIHKVGRNRERSLLLVTTTKMAGEAVEHIKKYNLEGYLLRGVVIVDCDQTGSEIDGVPVVTDQSHAAAYVCQEWIDEVLLVFEPEFRCPGTLFNQLMETGVTVHNRLRTDMEYTGRQQLVERMSNYMVLTSTINVISAREAVLKRLLDILGGIAGCILTGVIFIIIGPMIYISSPGPIFFSQVRVGKNGKRFKIYKFRSMYMDAEERKQELMQENRMKSGMMFKMDFDPRIIGNRILPDGTKKTGIGNFIRVSSLDEFPQFWNVLKGDMSLVGTRPPTLDEWEKYELRHRARLATKPGITGLWQVSGRSDITDFEEVVRLDTEYIKNWSFGLDMRILFKTVAVVFKRSGSR